jgi:hypothetical protein
MSVEHAYFLQTVYGSKVTGRRQVQADAINKWLDGRQEVVQDRQVFKQLAAPSEVVH